MHTFNRLLIIIFAIFLSTQGKAQSANQLLDRSFWRAQPSIEEIAEKIKEGHSPTEMTAFNFDATGYAILENNSLETIKYLLSEGNPIDKITHDGRTYLMWAAYKGNLELMQYLVGEGARTDIIDQHGYSLLMFPASTGQSNQAMYDYMIDDLEIDILQERDRYGRTALLAYAAKLQDFAMVDYFIEKGLDIHKTDANGNGVFHYAAQTGNMEVMKTLATKYEVSTSPNEKTNENAILFATKRFERSGVETDVSFYEFLEKEYALDPTIVSVEGTTALHNVAKRTKKVEVLRYFIEKGVDPNAVDKDGNNALLFAAPRGTDEMLTYLIENTDDINASNKDGFTALTEAVRSNSLDNIKLLVENGADVSVIDRNQNSLAFHLVDTYQSNDESFESKMSYLLQQGVDFKSTQNEGATLLHHAVSKKDTSLLATLLSQGIDINARDDNGETALHKAALQSQDDSMLRFLVSEGASLDAKTDFDESAYELAKNNEKLAGEDLEFLRSNSN